MRWYHPRTASMLERLIIDPLDRFSRGQIWAGVIAGYVAAAVLGWLVWR